MNQEFLEKVSSVATAAGNGSRAQDDSYTLPRGIRHARIVSGSNGLYTIRVLSTGSTAEGTQITGVRCVPPQLLAIGETVVIIQPNPQDPVFILGVVSPDDLIITGFLIQGMDDLGYSGTIEN